MAGTGLSSYKRGLPPLSLTALGRLSLSLHSFVTYTPLGSGDRLVLYLLVNIVVLGVGEQSLASGTALYSDFLYANHSKFVLGYLAMFVACLP